MKPFQRLRNILRARHITYEELGRLIYYSEQTVRNKLNLRTGWTLPEMYAVMDALEIPYSKLHEIFPKDGGV